MYESLASSRSENNEKYGSDRIISIDDSLVQYATLPVKDHLQTNIQVRLPHDLDVNKLTESYPMGQDITC